MGAVLGYMLTRRPIGILIGLILGHLYDVYVARRGAARMDAPAVREAFFRATFSIMGYVAKSDGRVSEQDIAAARRIFGQFLSARSMWPGMSSSQSFWMRGFLFK